MLARANPPGPLPASENTARKSRTAASTIAGWTAPALGRASECLVPRRLLGSGRVRAFDLGAAVGLPAHDVAARLLRRRFLVCRCRAHRGGGRLLRVLNALSLEHLVDGWRIVDGCVLDRHRTLLAVVSHGDGLPGRPALQPDHPIRTTRRVEQTSWTAGLLTQQCRSSIASSESGLGDTPLGRRWADGDGRRHCRVNPHETSVQGSALCGVPQRADWQIIEVGAQHRCCPLARRKVQRSTPADRIRRRRNRLVDGQLARSPLVASGAAARRGPARHHQRQAPRLDPCLYNVAQSQSPSNLTEVLLARHPECTNATHSRPPARERLQRLGQAHRTRLGEVSVAASGDRGAHPQNAVVRTSFGGASRRGPGERCRQRW